MNKTGCCGCNPPYKSVVWALVLALVLGPVGVAYTSILISILLGIVALVASGIWQVAAPYIVVVVWLVCVYASVFMAERHNRRLVKQAAGVCAG